MYIAICALAILLSLGGAGSAEFNVYRSKNFGLYSLSNCQRLEHADFDVAIACDFHGRKASFYLKELAAAPAAEMTREIQEFPRQMVLSLFASEIGNRVHFNEHVAGLGERRVTVSKGFLYRSPEDAARHKWDAIEQRVLFRSLNFRGLIGVLVVFSDYDVVKTAVSERIVIPEEVTIMSASLGTGAEMLP